MYLPERALRWLRWRAFLVRRRAPNVVLRPDGATDYLRRWWLIRRNVVANAYLHVILASDDDRALHDHPWPNVSIVLKGRYLEHRILAGGVHTRTWRNAGDVVLRRATAAHRLEVKPGEAAETLFLTGPRVRMWGFHCPQGWRDFRAYTSGPNGVKIGRGCD